MPRTTLSDHWLAHGFAPITFARGTSAEAFYFAHSLVHVAGKQ
jgi:hypothetical protein